MLRLHITGITRTNSGYPFIDLTYVHGLKMGSSSPLCTTMSMSLVIRRESELHSMAWCTSGSSIGLSVKLNKLPANISVSFNLQQDRRYQVSYPMWHHIGRCIGHGMCQCIWQGTWQCKWHCMCIAQIPKSTRIFFRQASERFPSNVGWSIFSSSNITQVFPSLVQKN